MAARVGGEALLLAGPHRQLSRIVDMAGEAADPVPVGAITAVHRDTVAQSYAQLLRAHPANATSLRAIEEAAFAVCLDDTAPEDHTASGRACLHGDGKNRWFDKPVQFLVFANGRAGFIGEVRRRAAGVRYCAGMSSRLSHVCPASALGNGRHLDGCHDEPRPAWVGAPACSAARVHIHHAAHSALVSPVHWQHRPRRAGCSWPGGLRGPTRCSDAAPLPCGRGRACIGTPWLLLARPEEQLTRGELRVQVERSVVAFNKTVAAHEVGTLVYTAYGKDWVRPTPTALTAPACLTLGLCGRGMLAQVKKQNMSPDAYAQMAIQLAYYRCAAREVVAVAIAPESTIHDRRPVVRFTACTAMSRRRTSQPTLASSCGGGRNASGRRLCRARRG